MSDSEAKAKLEIVKKHCDELTEHFDTVQLFCTMHEDEGDKNTLSFKFGKGNWFARYGQIREWVVKQDEGAKIETRKESEE